MKPCPCVSTVQIAETPPRHQTVKPSGIHFHNRIPTPFNPVGIEAHRCLTAKGILGLGLVFVILLTLRTEAAVTFSNPIRKVSSSNNRGFSHEIESNGFESFNERAGVEWEEYWEIANTTGHYVAQATQESVIGPTGILAKGSVSEGGSFYYWGDQPLKQSAHSRFLAGFTVGSPCDLILTGTIHRYVDYGGTNSSDSRVIVKLMNDGDEIYSFIPESDPYPQDYMWEDRRIDRVFHAVAPGEYQLIIEATADGYYDDYFGSGGEGGSGSLSYEISLIPEPMPFLPACLGALLFMIRRSR